MSNRSPPVPLIIAAASSDRRRIHYVDHMIQKWLLVALVVMECTLIAVAMWALYRELSFVIDENTYRIHFSKESSLLPSFMMTGSRILLGIGLVNLLAIVLADRIWAAYVRAIVRRLDGLIQEAQQMDFSPSTVHCTHAVLEHAVAWRADEADRMRKLRAGIRSLPMALPEIADDRMQAAQLLKKINQIASRNAA